MICGDESVSDVWIEDCSIASILVQMTAQSLGLGNCWVQIRLRQHDKTTSSEEYVRSVLNIPDNLNVLSIIGIGYPAENPAPIGAEDLKTGRIHINSW